MKFNENWVREWVNPPLTTQELAHQLTMAGLEVGSVLALANDALIEVELTPNRGDCLSVMGIAREIALLNGISYCPVKMPSIKPTISDALEISIKAPSACPHYVGRVIKNIHSNATTPAWIQQRLQQSDIKLRHPVVDIVNYVMLELGQPMHAFDIDKIQGSLIVRQATQDEKITLLDGQEISLLEHTLVIADSQQPQALAGIMGGQDSAVGPATTHIFLESALFTPHLIAGKARLYGLHTDSSFRFERGVSPDLQILAIERATALIEECCGGEIGPLIEKTEKQYLPARNLIALRYARLTKIVGITIEVKAVVDILHRLGCEIKEETLVDNHKVWQILPPQFRYDVTSEIDLIEEVIRVIGYNNIPSQLPLATLQFVPQPETLVTPIRIKRALVDLGYQEIITYSFVDEKLQKELFPQAHTLALMNPISAEMGVMRTSLWPGLLNALKYNQYRQQQRLKFFEIGTRFTIKDQGELEEIMTLSGLVCGYESREQWGIPKQVVDFFDIKKAIESLWELGGQHQSLTFYPIALPACHPGQSAQIKWQGQSKGMAGRLHPQLEKTLGLEGPIYLFEIDLSLFTTSAMPVFERPSRFPENRRDIAMIVDEALSGDSLINFVRNSAGDLLRDVKIFDVYTGKGIDSGRKSIAMGLILQHPSRTLIDQEVDAVVHTIVAGLKKEFNAELRD